MQTIVINTVREERLAVRRARGLCREGVFALAVSLTVVSRPAFAQDAQLAPPAAVGNGATLAPTVPARGGAVDVPRQSGSSVGRFLLESLVSSVVGSAAGYGTYRALCPDGICFGALAGLAVDVAVTPVTAWSLGEIAGGDGSLGKAYWGGVFGLGTGGLICAANPGVGLAVGTVLMPFTSALGYELSSRPAPSSGAAFVSPIRTTVEGHTSITGASLGVSGRF